MVLTLVFYINICCFVRNIVLEKFGLVSGFDDLVILAGHFGGHLDFFMISSLF